MKTKTINLYQLDELNAAAKEKAREWFRNGIAFQYDTFWSECIEEDAKEVGFKLTSWSINPIDGEGTFLVNAKECASKIIASHGKDCETFKLARAFLDGMEELSHEEDEHEQEAGRENMEVQFEADLAHEYACMLDREHTYVNSDESVDENIRANEYTFTEDGKKMD